jgi:hypothetical protein
VPLPDGATATWLLDPILQLFVLHVDGEPVADTSLVDPSLPRAEKIAALAGIEWLPPQQMTAEYNRIVAARELIPLGRPLPGNRRISPCRGGFGATIDGDSGPTGHPLGRYLFPEVDASGQLTLDPGESILTSWKSYVPTLEARREPTGDVTTTGTDVPSEIRNWRVTVTDRRVTYIAALKPPTAKRDDYPSVFLPPALFERIAAYRQIKRWATRPNLYWGFHIRHEWITSIACGNIPTRKRPLLLRYDDTMFIEATIRYPAGIASAVFRLPYKQGAPPLEEVASSCARAVESSAPARTPSPVETVTIQRGSRKPDTEVRSTWAIDGAHPWSIPPTVGA